MGKGLLVGLTGQTGAGKTTVGGYLLGRGYRVIDADIVARHVVAGGSKCILELAVQFGGDIILPDGTLDRRRMGQIVFGDREKRELFNKIIFPYILDEVYAQVERMRAEGVPLIFLDAPTLFESGINKSCDLIVSVIAPRELRLERIIKRDNLDRRQALNRIDAQHDDEFYISRSDFVVNNEGDLARLREQLDSVIVEIELRLKEGGE